MKIILLFLLFLWGLAGLYGSFLAVKEFRRELFRVTQPSPVTCLIPILLGFLWGLVEPVLAIVELSRRVLKRR